MQIKISYIEIRHYLQRHNRIDVGIEYLDSQTVRFSYKPYSLSPMLNLDARIKSVNEKELVLLYRGKTGVNMLIKSLVLILGKKIDKNLFEIDTRLEQVTINLKSIPGIQKGFEHLDIDDIHFEQKEVVLLLSLK